VSLRDRLNGRHTTGPVAVTDTPRPPAQAAPAAYAPPSRAVVTPPAAMTTASGMFGHRIEEERLDVVDQLKSDLHHRLIERLDLEALEQIKDEAIISTQIRRAAASLLRDEPTPLSQAQREEIIEQIVYEVIGLGPIEPLFRDPTISDILVNGSKTIFVERRGRLSKVAASFRNDAHLLSVIDRIVSRVGRRVDESSPMVDARLPDGSRVNAIVAPLALDGPVLSIRRFGADLSIEQLVANGAMNAEMMNVLGACVAARLNILISGGTGSGKTTLLNALASFIQGDHRIITIEDAAELRLQQSHVVRLETRPPNAEGQGEVVARDLVKNALRMRPDRIVVGEVRSGEALDMLQAMNTGHEGSLTTIHANSPRDALSRLETMILMAGTNLPNRAMREQISSALDLIVQVSRMSDGTRRIVSIVEVTGMEEAVIATQEIYGFKRRGLSPEGEVLGEFRPTGIRPTFMERLHLAGIDLPLTTFVE
jgi:pilus assembly protein CpaF